MSLINLPESFLYQKLPAGLIQLDERALIAAVVGGYQDRLEDLRSYSKKFQLFFSPVGLPEAGPNVVFVDLTTSAGMVLTRSLEINETTPADPTKLLAWASSQLNLSADSGASLANARFGQDLLRFVDANILDYLATNIGAVLYSSAVAENQPIVITDSGTFTAVQLAHQKLIETFFPRLRFKGTARSFEALGKLMGFDDVRMMPLWGRVSPRLPNDPGAAVNDDDFSEVPEYLPKQVLDPFYNPLNQLDGPYFVWSGTASNGTAATNYYPEVVNGFQPWVMFAEDAHSIRHGTLTPATGGVYPLAGGAAHFKASVVLSETGTFTALGEGDCWNGVEVIVTELDGTLRRLDIRDRLSAIKYRTSFYDLGITMDADKADAVFGTFAVRSNKDIAAAPHGYVSYSGTLHGTSPYRPFVGGTASFESTTGIQTSDFLTPFAGTVAVYDERREAALTDAQENFSDLARAGQGVTQALEEVRAATRQPRRAAYGYLQRETVEYAPILAETCILIVSAGTTAGTANTFSQNQAPLPPYTTGMSLYLGDVLYKTEDILDNRWPQRVFHRLTTDLGTLVGYTIPTAGSYYASLINNSVLAGTVCVEFYATVSPGQAGAAVSSGTIGLEIFGTAVGANYPNTHEVVRVEPATGTNRRYMDRPEDELDERQMFETLDEYPYRRDIVGGGEVIETDFSVVPGTNFVQYSVAEETMSVKDQTEVDFDVFVAFGKFPVPQFIVQPRTATGPGQRAICFQGEFRNQASLTVDDTEPFAGAGSRTAFFHSELDNVFEPGYALFHAGLVNGVLVADPDKFNGSHHLTGLRGWLPFNEHPEAALEVNDATMTLARQVLSGVAPEDRLWDDEQGLSLSVQSGGTITSSADRDCFDDFTLSFWVKTAATGGLAQGDDVVQFGNVKFTIDWTASPPNLYAQVVGIDGAWHLVNSGLPVTSDWQFAYFCKHVGQAWFGSGSLASACTETLFDALALVPNSGMDALIVSASTAPWQVRDLRVWNCGKMPAEMELVKNHLPQPTVVPYRIGHVLSLNTTDRYGLQVLPNGWLATSNMPAWVRTPKFANVVKYTGDGEYQGESYRKEIGLGGGTWLPSPWKLGEQFYSLTADGTVVVSTQTGALPGSNAFWQGDATGAPGSYIALTGGSTAQGSIAVVMASGSGSNPWPNRMEATNSATDIIWLSDDDGHVYQVQLEAQGTGAVFVATPGTASNEEQGNAQAVLATPGYQLGVLGDGSVVQKPYSGTVTTPPLHVYLHDTLLEDVSGSDALARWTDPSVFGLNAGAPALRGVGEISFTNASTLLAGTYRLVVDMGNIGKVDEQFDGFRVDITVGDTTFNETLLQGYTGSNFRGRQEINFVLDHDVATGWLLTFAWLNGFTDPSRGLARQLVIHGYELRRLETNLYEVTLGGYSTPSPVLTKMSLIGGPQWGTEPGACLVEINGYGTVAATAHESAVYPSNDTLRSRYPLANLLTGATEQRREDIINNGTFCLPDEPRLPVLLDLDRYLSGAITTAGFTASGTLAVELGLYYKDFTNSGLNHGSASWHCFWVKTPIEPLFDGNYGSFGTQSFAAPGVTVASPGTVTISDWTRLWTHTDPTNPPQAGLPVKWVADVVEDGYVRLTAYVEANRELTPQGEYLSTGTYTTGYYGPSPSAEDTASVIYWDTFHVNVALG